MKGEFVCRLLFYNDLFLQIWDNFIFQDDDWCLPIISPSFRGFQFSFWRFFTSIWRTMTPFDAIFRNYSIFSWALSCSFHITYFEYSSSSSDGHFAQDFCWFHWLLFCACFKLHRSASSLFLNQCLFSGLQLKSFSIFLEDINDSGWFFIFLLTRYLPFLLITHSSVPVYLILSPVHWVCPRDTCS